jgi:charged multivesicular body protein 2A
MMQSMKGATSLLGSMNRQMNLPALQRIAMEFERENEIMDERQQMMDDAIDEATGIEDEEESEDIVKEVLDEIGVDLGQAVRSPSPLLLLFSTYRFFFVFFGYFRSERLTAI